MVANPFRRRRFFKVLGATGAAAAAAAAVGGELSPAEGQSQNGREDPPSTKSNRFPGLWDNRGWGFGVCVVTKRDGLSATPGQYGWNGGYGSSWSTDPAEDLVEIVMTQRAFTSPIPPDVILGSSNAETGAAA